MKQFPFTAIVGMEEEKRSLVFHAIDPRLGGILLLGHRGCAKSTLARAFARILPDEEQGLAPFVEVPLGTTEDRLLGSVDAQKLVAHGRWESCSGLIEEANRGVLYIDEVNLLPDHLADFILDSAATGQYRMERDGLTRIVESRYILIGSMNPEEGDLRPQLSDRFAHGIRIHDDFSAEERMEIVRRRILFEDDPAAFLEAYASATAGMRQRIMAARQQLKNVQMGEPERLAVATRARELKLEGMRPELAVFRTARCAAAWDQRDHVTHADLEEAWRLCLGHRVVSQPPEPPRGTPPPRDPTTGGRSASSPASEISQHPIEARPTPRSVSAFSPKPPDALAHFWRTSGGERMEYKVRPHVGQVLEHPSSGATISWMDSLKVSLLRGWKPGEGGLSLRYRARPLKRRLWIFLDASRSTGAGHFLANARDVVGGLVLAVKSVRCHLLVLQGGRLQWKARNATARGICRALAAIREASGKSLITEGLHLVQRQGVRRGWTSHDRVLICSDGLLSPRLGETTPNAIQRLRHVLRRLVRSSGGTIWHHPLAGRGLTHWLARLCAGIPLQLVAARDFPVSEMKAGRP